MFALFRFDSFFSVWYWVLMVTVWTIVCQRTLGVPHDMILRAARDPAVAARVETLAHITAERWAGLADAAGIPLAAVAGFSLAALAALGFWNRVELAAAAFLLLFPLAIVTIGDVRLARRVRAARVTGEPLRRSLARRRGLNQGVAVVAILAAAIAALGHPPRAIAF